MFKVSRSPIREALFALERLQRISSGPINLSSGEAITVKSPTDVGTGKAADEKAPLSAVIIVLNDRFGRDFTEEERLFFDRSRRRLHWIAHHGILPHHKNDEKLNANSYQVLKVLAQGSAAGPAPFPLG